MPAFATENPVEKYKTSRIYAYMYSMRMKNTKYTYNIYKYYLQETLFHPGVPPSGERETAMKRHRNGWVKERGGLTG